MEISTTIHESYVIAQVEGEVDAYTARELNNTLMDLLGQGHRRIVIDVAGMTFISSAGIRAILFAHREAVQLDAEIRLVGPQDQVQRTFKIVGFFELFQISDTLQEAINGW